MNGQHYYQQRTLSIPDPFRYDYTYPVAGYWEWEKTNEGLHTPMSDAASIDPMSAWAEYGEDCIDAGPTSFPSGEYYPSQEEQLRVHGRLHVLLCPPTTPRDQYSMSPPRLPLRGYML